MDVGDVIKKQVHWGNLNDALADITLNLDHEYVQYILSKPRRSLCVIYETVATHGDSELDSDSSGQGVCHSYTKFHECGCYAQIIIPVIVFYMVTSDVLEVVKIV